MAEDGRGKGDAAQLALTPADRTNLAVLLKGRAAKG